MYNVSEEYITALRSGAPQFDIRGNIGVVQVQDSNILRGSLNILRQCAAKNEVSIGSVYTSELNVTFRNLTVPRNQWIGLTISLEEGLCIDDNDTYEYVPLGRYIISEASHTLTGVVVKAYDAMTKFEKAFVLSTTSGKPYNLLVYLCNQCGVPFGMTQAQVQALPNGNTTWELDADNDIETYRDYLSWIAQTMSCFAEIDRQGRLVLKKYKSEIDFNINQYQRFDNNLSFSDFISYYTGMSVVDFETDTTNYYSVQPDNGLTYNLGSNPFLQFGIKSVKDGMRRAVLQGMQAIHYTPFTVCNISAIYDLGDVIDFEDGLSYGAIGCVMQIEYNYANNTKLSGFGSDPALASAKSKTDKNLAGILNKQKDDVIQFYNYLNTEEYDIGDGHIVPVISLKFATTKARLVMFQAEILCDVETSDFTDIEVQYRLDSMIQTFKPIERRYDGRYILNLFYYIPTNANEGHSWKVFLKPTGGSIHIDIDNIRAVLWGQGLAAMGEWAGIIDFDDTFTIIPIRDENTPVVSFHDSKTISTQIPIPDDSIEQEFGVIPLNYENTPVVSYDVGVAFNKEIAKLYLWRELAAYSWDATDTGFIWG